MKRATLVFLCVFSLYITAQQERISHYSLGYKAGMDFTEAAGAKVNGYRKTGFAGGIFFRLKLDKKWSARFEILYIQKGSRNPGKPENGYIHNYSLRLQYVEWPLLLHYHKKRCVWEFGPGFGYVVHAREYYYNGTSGSGYLTGKDPLNQTELSFNLGVSFLLNHKWSLNCRYTNSIFPVRQTRYIKPAWYKVGMLNCVLALTLNRTFDLGKDRHKEKREADK